MRIKAEPNPVPHLEDAARALAEAFKIMHHSDTPPPRVVVALVQDLLEHTNELRDLYR